MATYGMVLWLMVPIKHQRRMLGSLHLELKDWKLRWWLHLYFSQDWLEYSSYKKRQLGISLGLLSAKYHGLTYDLGWRTLTDPSQMSSRSIRRQLEHCLLSSLKYTFEVDRRNSLFDLQKGTLYRTQFGGLTPDPRSLRFLRQV